MHEGNGRSSNVRAHGARARLVARPVCHRRTTAGRRKNIGRVFETEQGKVAAWVREKVGM